MISDLIKIITYEKRSIYSFLLKLKFLNSLEAYSEGIFAKCQEAFNTVKQRRQHCCCSFFNGEK